MYRAARFRDDAKPGRECHCQQSREWSTGQSKILAIAERLNHEASPFFEERDRCTGTRPYFSDATPYLDRPSRSTIENIARFPVEATEHPLIVGRNSNHLNFLQISSTPDNLTSRGRI